MSDVMIIFTTVPICIGIPSFLTFICFLIENKKIKEENEHKELSKFKHLAITKNGELFELTNPFVDKQYNEAGYFGIKYTLHKRKTIILNQKRVLNKQ